MTAATGQRWLVPLAAVLGLALPACQCVWGIEDRGLRVDGGGGDADTDAIGFACDPVAQSGCQSGMKCARHAPPGEPIRTECVPDGNRDFGESCSNSAPVDDCLAGLTCLHGRCEQNCDVAPGACGAAELTCRNGLPAFPDLPQFGVCDLNCDTTFQDCPAGEACFANEMLGETQCRELDPGSVLPGQDDPCFTAPGTQDCLPNGCDLGFGPHQLPMPPAARDCSFYCYPNDTWNENTDFANGGDPSGDGSGACATNFQGARRDGPGLNYQCRFLQTVHEPPLPFDDRVGICVDPLRLEWGDCQSCNPIDQGTIAATCPPGCLSQAFIDLAPPAP